MGDYLACTLTAMAGCFGKKKTPLGPKKAKPFTGRAGRGSCPGKATASQPRRASRQAGIADVSLRSERRIFQGDLEVVMKVNPSLPFGPGLSGSKEFSKNFPKEVIKNVPPGGEAPVFTKSFAASASEGSALPVVGGPFLRVLQHFIGLGDPFKMLFGRGISRIFIRMKLVGEAAISLLNLLLGGRAVNPQEAVIVRFEHSALSVVLLGLGFGDDDLGRPKEPVVKKIPLFNFGYYPAGFLIALLLGDCFVFFRIKDRPYGLNRFHTEFFEDTEKLFLSDLHPPQKGRVFLGASPPINRPRQVVQSGQHRL